MQIKTTLLNYFESRIIKINILITIVSVPYKQFISKFLLKNEN